MFGTRHAIILSSAALLLIAVVWYFSSREVPHVSSIPAVAVDNTEVSAHSVFPLDPILEHYSSIMSSGSTSAKSSHTPDLARIIAESYRLVTISFSTNASQSCAFIEHLADKTQAPFSIGARLGDVGTISEITRDGVCIQTASTNCWLSFGNSLFRTTDGHSSGYRAGDVSVAPASSYGIVHGGSNEWSIAFNDVLGYFDELKSRPERLEKLFDTFEPVYNGKAIQGYKINIKGEEDFLKSAGLTQGDFVKSVNYIQMNSRWQAEKIIEDVIKGKKNFIVFELERDGKKIQQKYHIQ